jgi:HK97 family phage prohead protease
VPLLTDEHYDAQPLEVDAESRTIRGLAVPWDQPGHPGGSGGRPVVFTAECLTRSLQERGHRVRLLLDHDASRPIGRLVEWSSQPEGLLTVWRIARTPTGDAALAEAAEGIRDGLSVGVDVLRTSARRDALEVLEARCTEVSLVSFPAFDAARVSSVAASESIPGRDPRILRLRLLTSGAIK